MPKRITGKDRIAKKKQELVQRLLCIDTRLFFNLPRDEKGNIIPLSPEKQTTIKDLKTKIKKLDSATRLTPAMKKW
ncbi:MAG: hypothetical protein ACTSPV_16355 [Candidatus Hodarchaeales archaeon]